MSEKQVKEPWLENISLGLYGIDTLVISEQQLVCIDSLCVITDVFLYRN